MSEIENIDLQGTNWLADIRGVHIGSAHVRFIEKSGKLTVDIIAKINGEILAIYGVQDDEHPNKFQLVSEEAKKTLGTELAGTLIIDDASLEKILASYELADGSRGPIAFIPDFNQPQEGQAREKQIPSITSPPQLIVGEGELGAVTLYRSELNALLDLLRSLIGGASEPIITAQVNGNRVTQYAKDFLSLSELPYRLNQMQITITSSGLGIQKSINIDLKPYADSTFWIQSDEKIWSNGVQRSIEKFFEGCSSVGTTFLRKYGLNFNAFLLLSVLILTPDLAMLMRILLMVVAVVLIVVIKKMHDFVPNSRVYLDDTKRFFLVREWPVIATSTFTILATTVIIAMFNLLSSDVALSWLKGLLPD